jgi:hypothetical protein
MQKKLRELEVRYKRDTKVWQRRIDQQDEKTRQGLARAAMRADVLFEFADNAKNEHLHLLRDFLAGKVTHYAFPCSYDPEIRSLEENKAFQTDSDYGRTTIEAIKLVSLWGNSDGNLEYRLHTYKDGSGGNVTIIPCRSRKEAVAVLQKELDAKTKLYLEDTTGRKSLYVEKWSAIKGIVIDERAIKKFNADGIATLDKKIEKLKLDLAEAISEKGDKI